MDRSMKKFIQILAVMHGIAIVGAAFLYVTGCFVTWQIVPIEPNWVIIRIIELLIIGWTFLMSLNKDL
tara:strand:- start:2194 stop:2397 length:204 start_codon:yes stop_codon:yes gene_type:complete